MSRFELGISSCGFQELKEEHFELLQRAGVGKIEISVYYDKYPHLDLKSIKEYAERYEIGLWSFHLPFQPFSSNDISSTDQDIREKSIRLQTENIKKAGEIGIGIAVIHPSAEPVLQENRQEALKYSCESLARLAEIASREQVVLAVENLPRTCLGRNSEEIKELISSNDKLKVCFDTNHLLSQPAKEFIEDIGDRIITTHFSDYDFKNERHWLPGEGKINWIELMEALEKVGYEGPVLYEVSLSPPASGSIQRRPLTFCDFKENHHCLVNKLPLKPIGTPVWEKCTSWEQ